MYTHMHTELAPHIHTWLYVHVCAAYRASMKTYAHMCAHIHTQTTYDSNKNRVALATDLIFTKNVYQAVKRT